MPGYVDPNMCLVVENITTEMSRQGWKTARLAKHLGCERSKLSKILNCQQGMPADILIGIAGVLGVPLDCIAGSRPSNDASQDWIPWYQEPTDILARFVEHEANAEEFITFDRLPAYSRMTEIVQDKVNLSRFAEGSGTAEGEAAAQAYETWGRARLKRYLDQDKEALPQITTFTPRRDFERMIERRWPFDRCTLQEISDLLDHQKTRCVKEKGFRLILIEDEQIDKHAGLARHLNALEAFGVLGRNFVYRKLHDSSVYSLEKPVAGSPEYRMLKRLSAMAAHGSDERSIIQQIDVYQRKVDIAIRDGHDKLRQETPERSRSFRPGNVANKIVVDSNARYSR